VGGATQHYTLEMETTQNCIIINVSHTNVKWNMNDKTKHD